jgi:hypothetical protein
MAHDYEFWRVRRRPQSSAYWDYIGSSPLSPDRPPNPIPPVYPDRAVKRLAPQEAYQASATSYPQGLYPQGQAPVVSWPDRAPPPRRASQDSYFIQPYPQPLYPAGQAPVQSWIDRPIPPRRAANDAYWVPRTEQLVTVIQTPPPPPLFPEVKRGFTTTHPAYSTTFSVSPRPTDFILTDYSIWTVAPINTVWTVAPGKGLTWTLQAVDLVWDTQVGSYVWVLPPKRR